MAKVKILHSVLILVLVSSLLVGCQTPLNKRGSNGGQSTAQLPERPQDLKQSLDELNKAYSLFNASITQFRNELKEVVKQTKNLQNVNWKNPNEKLEYLRKANNECREVLQKEKSPQDLQKEVTKIPNDLDATIKNIEKVIEPLKNIEKLKNEEIKNAVSSIQQYLKLDKEPDVSQNLGQFGPKTQNKIDSFLTEQNKQLGTKIGQLKQAMNLVTPADNTELSSLSSNPDVQRLVERVSALEKSNKILQTQFNELSQRIWIVVIVSIGTIGTLLYPLFRKLKASRLSQSPKKSQVSEYNSLFEQKNSGFTEQIYDHINKRYEQIYQVLEQKFSTQIHNQFITLESRLKALQRDLTSNYQDNSPHRNVAPNQGAISPVYQSRPAPINQYSTSSNIEWVASYNNNPNSFLSEAIEVSETEESLASRRLGTSQTAIFEKARRGKGNYWILIREGFNYLVPKANIKINEYNYETVETLFECQGYQSGYSNDFKLVKPAIVSPISSGEKWQLIELGVLQFL